MNETKLDSNIRDHEINLLGFDVIRKDRNNNGRNGGDVCIYFRTNLNYRIVKHLSPGNLELLTAEIINPCSKPFLISMWYRPPLTLLLLYLTHLLG